MIDFLTYLVSSVIDNPGDFSITESDEAGVTTYLIYVPDESIGRLIGKEGRVINSIRTLARLKANREGKHIIVKIDDSQKANGSSLPTTTLDGVAGKASDVIIEEASSK